jgi:hypothetical protein
VRFTPNRLVKDGYETYEPDQEYPDVPEDRVRHMVSHGFGTSPDLKPEPGNWSEPVTITTPPAAPITLRPDDAASEQSSDLT